MPEQKGRVGAFVLENTLNYRTRQLQKRRIFKWAVLSALIFLTAPVTVFADTTNLSPAENPTVWECPVNNTSTGDAECRRINNPDVRWERDCTDTNLNNANRGSTTELGLRYCVFGTKGAGDDTFARTGSILVRNGLGENIPIKFDEFSGTAIPTTEYVENPDGTIEEVANDNLAPFGTQEDFNLLGVLRDITLGTVAGIFVFVTEILVAALTGILGLISLVFDFVVVEFVVQMGKYITAPDATAVRFAWTLIRDLANIGIIGGLVAIAISTIIGSEKNGIQKNLARLLISALLVNFSYFFAGAVIDVSNFISRTIYTEFVHKSDCGSTNANGQRAGCGPASRLIRATTLDNLWDSAEQSLDTVTGSRVGGSLEEGTRRAFSATQAVVFNIMRMIFVIVTSFVFLSAISLLVARFVALIFLLITSPIGIAGMAVPILNKYADEWWKALWSQTMFAPVYFLLVGIALNMVDSFSGSLLSPQNGVANVVGVIAMFTIAIGFMWAALSTAQSMSKEAGRFAELYKASEKGLGWMPKAYTGFLKTNGAMALRNTVGGLFGEKGGMAYADWASGSKMIKEGKIAGVKIPGLKMAAGAVDRAIQQQVFDKARDAKFFGRPNFDEERKKRDARQGELDDLHKNQNNKEKAVNPEAMKRFGKRKKELEDLEKRGELDKPENDGKKKELEAIRKFERMSGDEAALIATRRLLEERRKRGALSKTESAQLADTKRRLDELRQLKDKFGIGGAIEKNERAQERHREVYNEGVARDYVNEEEAFKDIDDKIAAGAQDLTPEQELRLAKLSTAKATATAEGEEALNKWLASADGQEHQNLSKGITSGEREAHADYASRAGGINAAEEADLAARKGRLGTDKEQPDDLATIATLERRKKGLQKNALENDGQFRHRQITRTDGKGKKYILEYEEVDDGAGGKTKKPKWVEEADADYFERLDLDSNIGARVARTEGEEIAANFTKDFWEREYRKNHDSIIKYAPLMAKKKLLEIAQNHNIRESVREAMIGKVGAPWTQMIIDVEDRVRTGQLTRGSAEYQKAILVPYNYQSNNLKDYDLVAEMLLSDAVAGYSTVGKDGKPILRNGQPITQEEAKKFGEKIRFRDMWGETYRKSFWQGSLSGTFKHLKDNKILGDTALRDARTAKGAPFDVERDQWTGAAELEGYGGTSPDRQEFVPIEGGTVQLDTPVRLNNWIKEALRQTEGTKKPDGTVDKPGVIPQYLADMASKGSSTIPEQEFRAAVETNRWAKMLQRGEAESPLANTVKTARNLSALDPTRRADIAQRIESITGEPASDEQIATFNQGQALHAQRKNVEERLAKKEWGNPKNPDVSKMSDEDFYWYKKIKNEANVRDRYQGKTPEEIQSIFNRRSYWSPAMAIGISAKQLVTALEPHDPQERTAILENILKFGDTTLIKDLATNEQIRKDFDWPDEARVRKLALIRAGIGGDDLPIDEILAR